MKKLLVSDRVGNIPIIKTATRLRGKTPKERKKKIKPNAAEPERKK